eukprot:ANDGO_03023.mRNA.1 hypothetical protein
MRIKIKVFDDACERKRPYYKVLCTVHEDSRERIEEFVRGVVRRHALSSESNSWIFQTHDGYRIDPEDVAVRACRDNGRYKLRPADMPMSDRPQMLVITGADDDNDDDELSIGRGTRIPKSGGHRRRVRKAQVVEPQSVLENIRFEIAAHDESDQFVRVDDAASLRPGDTIRFRPTEDADYAVYTIQSIHPDGVDAVAVQQCGENELLKDIVRLAYEGTDAVELQEMVDSRREPQTIYISDLVNVEILLHSDPSPLVEERIMKKKKKVARKRAREETVFVRDPELDAKKRRILQQYGLEGQ